MSSIARAGFLLVAGVVAGIVGTAGGITSVVSCPALVIVGIPPLDASIANLVAAVPCLPGSMLASRRELRGTGSVLTSLMPAILGA